MQAWSHQHQGNNEDEEPSSSSSGAQETATSSEAPVAGQQPGLDDSGPYERIPGDTSEEEEQEENKTVIETSHQRKFGQLGTRKHLS